MRAKAFKIIFLITIAVSTASARAEEPVIATQGISGDELRAFAQARHVEAYADFLDRERPVLGERKELASLVEKAQARWLSGALAKAQSYFRAIAELALSADWNHEQQEAIQYAFLRLAQTAVSDIERDEWLQKAARIFPEVKPAADLFPPPLLERFKSLREKELVAATVVVLGPSFQNFRTLLVDGDPLEIYIGREISLTPGAHRITLFSDIFAPQSAVLTASALASMQPSLLPLVTGTCAAPTAAEKAVAKSENFLVLFPGDCVRTSRAGRWNEIPHTKDLGVSPFGESKQEPLRDALQGPAGTHGPWEAEIRKPNAAWFWAIAAGIGAAVYLHEQAMHDSNSAPVTAVHRSGL